MTFYHYVVRPCTSAHQSEHEGELLRLAVLLHKRMDGHQLPLSLEGLAYHLNIYCMYQGNEQIIGFMLYNKI